MYQFVASLFYSTLFCCGGKANLVQFTLFYSTLLTLTDGQTDRGTNTLALRGLVEPFFQLTIYVLRVPYSCGVVLVLLVLAGNSFWCYART